MTTTLIQPSKTDRFAHLVRRHPCFNAAAHNVHGRIHLPVSPACNIHCLFCGRGVSGLGNHPGLAREVISPEQALVVVDKALELCPEITVVGVAGPGEPLASTHALKALRLVHEKHPDLIGCLSTNGLRLSRNVDEIKAVGVRTLTVTVNALEPAILQQLNGGIYAEGRYQTGIGAAERLICAQLDGIKKAAEIGLVVKINTVLTPGINETEIERIAETMAGLGASLMNVMPLIPQQELSHIPEPTCEQITVARAAAEKHLPVFRHCRRCRADAAGVPGKGIDIADKLYDVRGDNTFSHG